MKKRCTKCGIEKLATIEFFHSCRTHKDGLRSACKECIKKHTKTAEYRLRVKKYIQLPRRKSYRKNYLLKRNYGITLEQYDQMLEKQNGVCAICGSVNSDGRKLFVDHDHKTGKVRKLLCHSCNIILGDVKDDKLSLIKIIKYLEENF